jgi:hypothetical protein
MRIMGLSSWRSLFPNSNKKFSTLFESLFHIRMALR